VPRLSRIPDADGAPRGPPLLELYQRYIEFGLANKAQSTIRNHLRTRALAAALPPHPTPGDIAVWLAGLQANAGLGPRYVRAIKWNLQRVYSYANLSCWALGNPAALAPWATPPPAPRAILDCDTHWPQMLAVTVEAVEGGTAMAARIRGMMGVFRYAGLRLAEALALKRTDVLKPAGKKAALRLSITKQRPQHGWTLKPPKSSTAMRQVPVREPLRRLLEPVLLLPVAEVWVGRGRQTRVESPLLFPFVAHQLGAMQEALCDLLPEDFGEGDGWHVLRHTCALELYEQGLEPKAIQMWLGHASLHTTETYLSALVGRDMLGDHVLAGLDQSAAPVPGLPTHEGGLLDVVPALEEEES
jgi:integrase